jgi:hypothetical protein
MLQFACLELKCGSWVLVTDVKGGLAGCRPKADDGGAKEEPRL